MLELNREISSAVLPIQKEQIQSRIDYTDDKISSLVYELYRLTVEEIALIENAR
ncbi:MAG: hypothetical protein NTU51_04710 [Bacteroidetes bacterium]|nr:hypothetical protein [Bacteroidota bacterium]